jgi:hypothetical protein
MNKLVATLSLLLVPACTVTSSTGATGGTGATGPSAPSAPVASAPAPMPMPPPTAPCIDAGAADITDVFDAARPLDATSTTTLCTERGDVDVFTVAMPAGGAGSIVRYRLVPAREMAPVLEILDGNRRSDRTHRGRKGEEVTGWAYVAAGTSMFFKVRQVHGVSETYQLGLDTGALDEPGEPNNGMAAATALPEAGAVTGFLARPLNDATAAEDWFRVELTTAGPLTVDVDMSQGVSSRITLFDARNKDIGRKGAGRGERYQHTFTKLLAGTYFLKLDSMHRLESSGQGELPESLQRAYTITTAR